MQLSLKLNFSPMLGAAPLRFICLALIGACAVHGVEITVGRNVQVSKAHPGDAHYEVYNAADLKHPGRLVVASFRFPRDGAPGETIVYASRDGGLTWNPTLEGKMLAGTGDPALAYGPDGTAYYAVSHIPAVGPRTMWFFRSKDGGLTWAPHDTLTYTDREYIAVDATGGKYDGRVYVNGNNRIPPEVSDIVIFYSSDQGRHFTGPGKRPDFGKYKASEMGNSVVASDGTVIAVFGQSGMLYAVTSTDGGESFGEALPVAEFVPGGNRKGAHNNVNSLPALAIDATEGKYKERLYAVWPDRRHGHSAIYFAASPDQGKTWTKARAINDNPPGDTTDQGMPEIAVNRDGIVGVIWSDRRNHPDNLGWDIRFTASLDGGETFAPSRKVSERGMDFDEKALWAPLTPASQKGLTLRISVSNFLFIGGDTWGLTADADGVFHPAWVSNATGAAQIWTAPVRVSPRERLDLSKQVVLEMSAPVLDRKSGTLTVSARVVNISEQAVNGPFQVRIKTLTSELADIAAESEEWSYAEPSLAPGAASAARTLRFHLSNIRPFFAKDRARLGLLNLNVIVLGGN
jgi:hypothetical protein